MSKLLIACIGILALLVALAGCTTGGAGGPSIDSITADIISGPTTEESTDTAVPQTQEGVSVEIRVAVSNFEVVGTIGETVTPTGNETVAPADGYFVYYMELVPEEAIMPTMTPSATPAPTMTPTATPTMTPTPTATATAPATPTATETMSPTPAITVTPTSTVTPTATMTPSSTPAVTPTATATATPEATATPTATMTPTATATPTPTMTPTPTATATAPATPTATPTESYCIPFTPGVGAMSFASTDTSYTWENLGEGTYIFWVELVDVDGESLMPPVIAAALLTVTVEPEETTVPAQTTTPAAATTSPAATTPEETEMP